ncbi:unnamed protein product [Effrenium voratum]|uniref:Uncharacterized protein n=1 Tax=Effrenium voratum TaxID=2562239 RepID=A0AA36N116_9DINO|nr:unnamed protein product [Effrenium voratum]
MHTLGPLQTIDALVNPSAKLPQPSATVAWQASNCLKVQKFKGAVTSRELRNTTWLHPPTASRERLPMRISLQRCVRNSSELTLAQPTPPAASTRGFSWLKAQEFRAFGEQHGQSHIPILGTRPMSSSQRLCGAMRREAEVWHGGDSE